MKKIKQIKKQLRKAIKPSGKKAIKKIRKATSYAKATELKVAKKIKKVVLKRKLKAAVKKITPVKTVKKFRSAIMKMSSGEQYPTLRLEDLFPISSDSQIFLTSAQFNVPEPEPQIPMPLPEPNPIPEPPMPPIQQVSAIPGRTHMFYSIAVPRFRRQRQQAKPAVNHLKHELAIYTMVAVCALFIGGIWLSVLGSYFVSQGPNDDKPGVLASITAGIEVADIVRQEIAGQLKAKLSDIEVMILGQETIKSVYAEEVRKTLEKKQ